MYLCGVHAPASKYVNNIMRQIIIKKGRGGKTRVWYFFAINGISKSASILHFKTNHFVWEIRDILKLYIAYNNSIVLIEIITQQSMYLECVTTQRN